MEQNKKTTSEIGIGTIFALGFLISVLIFGSVVIKNMFSKTDPPKKTIDDYLGPEFENELKSYFQYEEEIRMVFIPLNRKVKLIRGSKNDGFAFLVYNQEENSSSFRYEVGVDKYFDLNARCSALTFDQVISWMGEYSSGIIEQVAGNSLQKEPTIIRFKIPKDAPNCTIPFIITIYEENEPYYSGKIYMTIID